jgi:N-acetylmuramoyl-L-alanine amidase
MLATWRPVLLAAVGLMMTTAATLSAQTVAEVSRKAPALSYDLTSYAPGGAADPALAPVAQIDDASLDCMAKVVHHESRGQPRRGMIAVAQTLVNRMKAGGRFGSSICEVANQPGQYFQTAAYHPRHDGDWDEAVAVSRDTLSGTAEAAAPGALFFHAAYRAPSSFFRGRARVAAIGGQVFYR